jgi:hypothetical protein
VLPPHSGLKCVSLGNISGSKEDGHPDPQFTIPFPVCIEDRAVSLCTVPIGAYWALFPYNKISSSYYTFQP